MTETHRGEKPDNYAAKLAAAKLIGNFAVRSDGELDIEKDSVYGAAILIPQLARSAGWPKMLTCLTLRTFVFHVLNLILQGTLVVMIAKEEGIMDLFAGQMYLCDFGAWLSECPGSPGCTGPGGTPISAPRMYSWSQWSVRNFMRDGLKAVFPEKASEIAKHVDPGEYGLESQGCRMLCCFIYMTSVMNELFLVVSMLRLIILVPTSDDMWLESREDTADEDSKVRVYISGMPCFWKIFNLLVVLLPKCLLFKLTAESGVTLLMETQSIEDLIVNSVALSFVLNLDEMLCESLMPSQIKVMLEKCEAFPLYDDEEEAAYKEADIMKMHCEQQSLRYFRFRDIFSLLPPKLVAACVLTSIFIAEYYWTHCQWSPEHRWFSVEMHLPKGTTFSAWEAFFPRFFPVEADQKPYWTMPKVVG